MTFDRTTKAILALIALGLWRTPSRNSYVPGRRKMITHSCRIAFRTIWPDPKSDVHELENMLTAGPFLTGEDCIQIEGGARGTGYDLRSLTKPERREARYTDPVPGITSRKTGHAAHLSRIDTTWTPSSPTQRRMWTG